jgi:hypothetical protein
MILMIADLTTRLDKTEGLLNSVLARFNELKKPHNLVRRAARSCSRCTGTRQLARYSRIRSVVGKLAYYV